MKPNDIHNYALTAAHQFARRLVLCYRPLLKFLQVGQRAVELELTETAAPVESSDPALAWRRVIQS